MKKITRHKVAVDREYGHSITVPDEEGGYILYEDYKRVMEEYVRYEEFRKLQQALIDIRDYDPGHCHGDVGCQMSDTLEFNSDTIEEVKDLL